MVEFATLSYMECMCAYVHVRMLGAGCRIHEGQEKKAVSVADREQLVSQGRHEPFVEMREGQCSQNIENNPGETINTGAL